MIDPELERPYEELDADFVKAMHEPIDMTIKYFKDGKEHEHTEYGESAQDLLKNIETFMKDNKIDPQDIIV